MAQHGYLREYDQGWDRGDDRDRDRWRGDNDRSERDRNFMLGDREHGGNRERRPDRDDGFFDRMGDRARSWMGDDDHRQRQGRSDWERAPRNFSSHQDDHYRSWRDSQVKALDRDYEDYCREREQQFHQDFDSWRQNRQQPTGQSGQANSSEAVMELNKPAEQFGETVTPRSPMADATLGTNNSENNLTGGRTRR